MIVLRGKEFYNSMEGLFSKDFYAQLTTSFLFWNFNAYYYLA
jgi:hypothetical protein